MILKWFRKHKNTKETDELISDGDRNLIIEAIENYRADCKRLMLTLGEKYNLDITKTEDYDFLIWVRNDQIPRKGELSKRWNYYFHGAECGFYNKKHKQQVEVVLSNPPNFGHVDSWFLLSYMQTTEKYRQSVKNLNWQQLKLIIKEMYAKGEIEYIE